MEIQNRTHSSKKISFEEILRALKKRITAMGDLDHVSKERQLEIVDLLCEFRLGRFILENRGANGFWTDYMISHPQNGRISGLNIDGQPLNLVEDFLLNRCPVVLAHQERFCIFKRLIQERLTEDCIMASIPCGLMRDLLELDFSKIKNYKLIGIDIDEESLALASKIAYEKKINNVEFIQKDAWQIQYCGELDLITSSGLNVYEADSKKVLELYSKFFSSLKPGGVLITSVLTYPPGEAVETDWNLKIIPQDDLLLDQIVHKDILGVKWRNFRSSDRLIEEFKQAGFSEVSVHFDRYHIFPTIFAKKALI